MIFSNDEPPLKMIGDHSQELFSLVGQVRDLPGVFFTNDRFSFSRYIILKFNGEEEGDTKLIDVPGGGGMLG